MHTRGRVTSKDVKKLGHKNATKHRNRGAPYILSQPQEPPHNNLKTTVYLSVPCTIYFNFKLGPLKSTTLQSCSCNLEVHL